MTVDDDQDDLDYHGEIDPIEEFAHWLEAQYVGDDRFGTVELDEEGQLDEEDFRFRMIAARGCHFFVAAASDEGYVRVGLAVEDEAVNKTIEKAIEDSGGSPADFLAQAAETHEELDYEAHQFHDDVFYFASEIPFGRTQDLGLDHLREDVVAFLEAYITGYLSLVQKS